MVFLNVMRFICQVLWRQKILVLVALTVNSVLVVLVGLFLLPTPFYVEHSTSTTGVTTLSPSSSLSEAKSHLTTKKWKPSRTKDAERVVEIWGKAAISLYLWKHILAGVLYAQDDGLWHYGEQTISGIHFKFRTGPAIIQNVLPHNTEWLVLVLNGRTAEKVTYAQTWLDYLPKYTDLRGVILVLLGNERCKNAWVTRYLKSNGGHLNAVFLVYDSTLVDEKEVFQWPLGVATYREFPDKCIPSFEVSFRRESLCNFIGTVYQNSSRELLVKLLKTFEKEGSCIIKPRYKWEPGETKESLELYVNALRQSELTLAPVGVNAESYRVYEAMACGSVPVLEDKTTEGDCDPTAFRLFKKYQAPIKRITDWNELPRILQEVRNMSLEEKIERRRRAFFWYKQFKNKMKNIFINVIQEKFF